MKKLLINGAIKEHFILIVDTPDSYLHPDWQVHFARLYVLLQERMNVRILVTTQSPVMLRALQVFAAKRGSPERIRYYLLEEDNTEVELRDVTLSTNRIYEEFAHPFDILDAIRWSD